MDIELSDVIIQFSPKSTEPGFFGFGAFLILFSGFGFWSLDLSRSFPPWLFLVSVMDNLPVVETQNQVQSDNLSLIYSYTESFLKTRTDNIARIETRLSTMLAFTGVAIKLASDLPSAGQIQALRTASIIALTIGVIIIGNALRSKRIKGYVTPQELVEDWYDSPEPDLKGFIASQWLEIDQAIEAMGQRKAIALNGAIGCLMFAGVCYGLAIVSRQ
jgi:hypothetical protein